MKNTIRRILKEEFDWIENIRQFNPAEQFLYDLMSNLTISESKKLKNWMLYRDEMDKILMVDNINTGTKDPSLYVDYNQIWLKLRDNYGLSYDEAMALCVRMLEIAHKRKVLTANKVSFIHN